MVMPNSPWASAESSCPPITIEGREMRMPEDVAEAAILSVSRQTVRTSLPRLHFLLDLAQQLWRGI